MRRTLLSTLTVLAVLVPAESALAATPVQLATNGAYPVIAVGPDGTGHVAWEIRPDSKDIVYCRIPAGGTTCTPQTLTGVTLSAGGAGSLNIFAPTASKVVIEASVTGCGSGALYGLEQWVSTDGGASFGTGVCRTTSNTSKVVPTRGKNFFDNANDRFIAAGGSASGRSLLATPAGIGQVTGNQEADNPIFTTSNYYDVAVGAGGTGPSSFLVAAAYSQDSTKPGIVYSVFNQPFAAATSGAVNTPGNWTKDIVAPGGEKTIDPPNVVSGPSGTYLVYQDENIILNDRIAVAKFQPDPLNLANSRFAAPVLVDGAAGDDTAQSLSDAAEDTDGRVHLIWNGGNRIRYAVSSDGGATFQTLGTLLADASPTTKDFAAGPGGKGWMVYISDSTTVKLIPLEPSADPLPTPAPTPTPTPTTPRPTTRNVTSTVPGASITFGVPNQCVQPGATFKVTLSWKRKKKKGNKFVKVTRADFSIGAKVVKSDRKAPFVQTLKVTASAKRGSTINLRARAFIKVKKGKAPKKSIKAQIKVCA